MKMEFAIRKIVLGGIIMNLGKFGDDKQKKVILESRRKYVEFTYRNTLSGDYSAKGRIIGIIKIEANKNDDIFDASKFSTYMIFETIRNEKLLLIVGDESGEMAGGYVIHNTKSSKFFKQKLKSKFFGHNEIIEVTFFDPVGKNQKALNYFLPNEDPRKVEPLYKIKTMESVKTQ